jgi:hypothetical protein
MFYVACVHSSESVGERLGRNCILSCDQSSRSHQFQGLVSGGTIAFAPMFISKYGVIIGYQD